MSVAIVLELGEDTIRELARQVAAHLDGGAALANAGMLAPGQPPFTQGQPQQGHSAPGAAPQPASAAAPPPGDPWGAPPQSAPMQAPAPARPPAVQNYTQPPAPTNAPSDPNVRTITTRNGVQTWHLGTAGAPPCNHGQPAARVTGTSQAGKAWVAYKCALGVGDQWRNKCDFNQFTR